MKAISASNFSIDTEIFTSSSVKNKTSNQNDIDPSENSFANIIESYDNSQNRLQKNITELYPLNTVIMVEEMEILQKNPELESLETIANDEISTQIETKVEIDILETAIATNIEPLLTNYCPNLLQPINNDEIEPNIKPFLASEDLETYLELLQDKEKHSTNHYKDIKIEPEKNLKQDNYEYNIQELQIEPAQKVRQELPQVYNVEIVQSVISPNPNNITSDEKINPLELLTPTKKSDSKLTKQEHPPIKRGINLSALQEKIDTNNKQQQSRSNMDRSILQNTQIIYKQELELPASKLPASIVTNTKLEQPQLILNNNIPIQAEQPLKSLTEEPLLLPSKDRLSLMSKLKTNNSKDDFTIKKLIENSPIAEDTKIILDEISSVNGKILFDDQNRITFQFKKETATLANNTASKEMQISMPIKLMHSTKSNEIKIELYPDKLGKVTVKLEFNPASNTKTQKIAAIKIIAEADTLRLLQHLENDLRKNIAHLMANPNKTELEFSLQQDNSRQNHEHEQKNHQQDHEQWENLFNGREIDHTRLATQSITESVINTKGQVNLKV